MKITLLTLTALLVGAAMVQAEAAQGIHTYYQAQGKKAFKVHASYRRVETLYFEDGRQFSPANEDKLLKVAEKLRGVLPKGSGSDPADPIWKSDGTPEQDFIASHYQAASRISCVSLLEFRTRDGAVFTCRVSHDLIHGIPVGVYGEPGKEHHYGTSEWQGSGLGSSIRLQILDEHGVP